MSTSAAARLMLSATLAACGGPAAAPVVAPTPYVVALPPFMTDIPVPADNPLTVEGVALGRHLFYDPLLSSDRTITCASCHQQDHGFSDPRPVSIGVDGKTGRRNAMPLFNLAWSEQFFWDGRSPTIEDQVVHPIQNELEMNRKLDELVADLKASERYPAMFRAAFGDAGITSDTLAKALAQFVRSIVSFGSPWDHHDEEHPEKTFDNESMIRGWRMFTVPFPVGDPDGRLGLCDDCHTGAHGVREDWKAHYAGTFATGRMRNDGLVDPRDAGAFEVTGREEDRGVFKVPSLRNLTYTAPFMHDGRFATLADVLRHYDQHIEATPSTDPSLMRAGQPLRMNFTEAQIADMVAFFTRFDDPTLATNPAWSNPFEAE